MSDVISNLADLSADELLQRYRSRDLSPVEVTTACLERIERHDEQIAAFCLVDADRALAEARESEARWRETRPRGLLDGVPVAVKDVFLTAGWPTRRGFSTPSPGADALADAPAVAALRRHGAVLVGKTTTPQLGWKAVTDAPGARPTRNPWDLARTAGGSSGGSAAAVALGMAPLAVGTDGGGSIRIPGAFCGIVGLKPTFARVPQWPASPFGLVAHSGPMARTVSDTALLLDVLAEPDPRDWSALPGPPGRYSEAVGESLDGVRVALSPDLGYAEVSPEVETAVVAAALALGDLGVGVERVVPGFDDPRHAFDVLWAAGASRAVAALGAEQRAELDPGLVALVEWGGELSAAAVIEAEATRAQLGSTMGVFHRDWDVLVTPTTPTVAFDVGRDVPADASDPHWPSWTPFTYPFNITQQPAITVPCGSDSKGLPIGLQIVGPRHREDMVLRVARAYEELLPL